MPTPIEILESEVLGLPPAERSRLLERLIASLDTDPDIQDALANEAARRDAEIDSGAVTLVPGPEAIARLRAKIQ